MADRTVLDEATDAVHAAECGCDGPADATHRTYAEVVLRVAEKRLRAYGYADAANAVAEGIADAH